MPITIAGVHYAQRHKRKFDAILSIEDPGARPGHRLRFHKKPRPHHLVLPFEDIDASDERFIIANRSYMLEAFTFGAEHYNTNLLIHCHHGVGRSAAIALAILADQFGPGNEAAAVEELFHLRPEATPTLHVVALADDMLLHNGALRSALAIAENAMPGQSQKREARRLFFEQNQMMYTRRPF